MLTRLANAHRGAEVHSNASMPCLMAMTSLCSSLSAYNCPQQYSPTTFQSASQCACRHFRRSMLTRLANAHRGAEVHSNASMPCLMTHVQCSAAQLRTPTQV